MNSLSWGKEGVRTIFIRFEETEGRDNCYPLDTKKAKVKPILRFVQNNRIDDPYPRFSFPCDNVQRMVRINPPNSRKKEARQHGVVVVCEQPMWVSIYEPVTRPTSFDSPMAVS
jgi:hypothetical protein